MNEPASGCSGSQIYPGSPVEILREFGQQPVSNRFPEQPGNNEFFAEMTLALCPRSGLVQLREPFPAGELRPRVPWLTVFEPEGHLDAMVAKLAGLPGLTCDDIVAGYSSKDDSTLLRMAELGFRKQWRLDPVKDLGISDPSAFVETFQLPFVQGAARRAASLRGRPKVFLVRHVLEHSYNLMSFLRAASDVVDDSGYVVFEVPDCTRALEELDYTTLWEEHSVYFTPPTFREALRMAGLEPVFFEIYPHPFENCMVAICKKGNAAEGIPAERIHVECDRARRFGGEFPAVTSRFQDRLRKARSNGRRLALFGAGHLASAFLCLHRLEEFFEFVVDDNPQKSGKFMAGTSLQIRSSSCLVDERIDDCLLSLNPESEDKVVARNVAFLAAAGSFFSIFPSSNRYFFR